MELIDNAVDATAHRTNPVIDVRLETKPGLSPVGVRGTRPRAEPLHPFLAHANVQMHNNWGLPFLAFLLLDFSGPLHMLLSQTLVVEDNGRGMDLQRLSGYFQVGDPVLHCGQQPGGPQPDRDTAVASGVGECSGREHHMGTWGRGHGLICHVCATALRTVPSRHTLHARPPVLQAAGELHVCVSATDQGVCLGLPHLNLTPSGTLQGGG